MTGVAIPEPSKIVEAVSQALDKIRAKDEYLLAIGANERTLTTRFAMYLQEQPVFGDWDVDHEYNRNGTGVPKSLAFLDGNVIPDVIIHKRGPDGPNLLVIEAKKGETINPADVKKVCALIDEYEYRFGLCVSFGEMSTHTRWFKGPELTPARS